MAMDQIEHAVEDEPDKDADLWRRWVTDPLALADPRIRAIRNRVELQTLLLKDQLQYSLKFRPN